MLIRHNTRLIGLFQVWRDCETFLWGARSKASRHFLVADQTGTARSLRATRGGREIWSVLYRQAHFLEKVGVSRVVVEIRE